MIEKQRTLLDGEAFRALFAAGTHCLEGRVEEINALNVYPVPDGDTGINMLLTLRSAESEFPANPPEDLTGVSTLMARGCLMGARGNSGVIFAQYLKGLALGFDSSPQCDGLGMANALMVAARAAYQAVSEPTEGTMLTVMYAAAVGASSVRGDLPLIWEAAYSAALEALARTPEQLPILKQAGVVDAGGQGVVAFMAGAKAFLNGDDEAIIEITAPVGKIGPTTRVSGTFMEHTEEELYGYCTNFLILGERLSPESVRDLIVGIARSVVVVGDETVIKVHAHSQNPGELLSLGVGIGKLGQIKIDNMDDMHQDFMEHHGHLGTSLSLAVVAVCQGDGLIGVMEGLGAKVVSGGQSMNPSVKDIMEIVQGVPARHVMLLPNNPNVLLAAQEAKELCDVPCTVIPSRTVPQGIASLLAFNPDLDSSANEERMREALTEVLSGEVTTAARAATIDDLSVEPGQAIALLEGQLIAKADDHQQALLQLLKKAEVTPENLITIYRGFDTTDHSSADLVKEINRIWPKTETELIWGGQLEYQYLVSIE